LKEFPILSYHKYKYTIVFFDDCTSHAWITLLCNKAAAISATRQFIALVKTQYKSQIKAWMLDFGGEYKSEAFLNLLKDEGIKIHSSVPYTPQQNGQAERFMHDKSEAIRIYACIPDSWWEFALLQGVHIYNRTPIRRLNWQTPHESLHGEVPRVDHLQVFGYGAYVHIPANIPKNKLSPKSELMTVICSCRVQIMLYLHLHM
jgi:transposase InsO family protein